MTCSINANLVRTRLLRPLCALISTATDQADAVEAELFLVPYPFTLHQNYRNAHEIATWLKENHVYAADPNDQLPSSNRPVQSVLCLLVMQDSKLGKGYN